jgi:hypothetical protein
MSNLDPNSFLRANIRNVKKLSDISENFKKHEQLLNSKELNFQKVIFKDEWSVIFTCPYLLNLKKLILDETDIKN